MKIYLNSIRVIYTLSLLVIVTLFSDDSAAFPVPDTGVTQCYNDSGTQIPCPTEGNQFYGQDANYGPGTMSFVNNGDGTVTDNSTSLMWEMKNKADGIADVNNPNDSDNTYQWDSLPQEFIAKLNQIRYAGYNDWRLPSARELASILDLSKAAPGPMVDLSFFSHCAQGGYWSSDLKAGDTTKAWVIYFDTALDGTPAKTESFSARAVRGGY